MFYAHILYQIRYSWIFGKKTIITLKKMFACIVIYNKTYIQIYISGLWCRLSMGLYTHCYHMYTWHAKLMIDIECHTDNMVSLPLLLSPVIWEQSNWTIDNNAKLKEYSRYSTTKRNQPDIIEHSVYSSYK